LAEAIQCYDAMLAQVPTHETALLERAETLGWAGRYREAQAGYLAFRKAYPARALTADLALARLAAWQNHTREALTTLTPWVAQEQRQAILDGATYLSWNGQLQESLLQVRHWLAAHPGDREALLLEARVLSWAGQNEASRQAYRRVLALAPEDREALIGMTRLSLWEGDPAGARKTLDHMPPEVLAHPDTQLLLAQVEAAEGHAHAARLRTDTLARGGPAQRDAMDLREDLIQANGPWVEVTTDRTDTSEGLRTENPGLRARLPLGDGALNLGYSTHRSDFQGAVSHPAETSLGLSYPLGGRFTASGTLRRLSDGAGAATWGYAFGLGFAPLPGLDLSLSRERSLALFTPQATALRTVFLTTDLGGTWRFGQGRHALSGSLGQTEVASNPLTGPQSSTRRSHMAAYEYRFPVTAVELRGGLMLRGFGYSPSLPLGFFNPGNYHWSGAFGSATWRRGRRLELNLSGQAGNQTVNAGASQFTWSYRTGLTWRPRPWPVDLTAWWSQSLAGLPLTTPSDPTAYREHTLGFGVRIHGNRLIL
jgi:tetratricopeptide (TPR) repeat protein